MTSHGAVAGAAELLDAHPDYRVIRRMLPRSEFAEGIGMNLAKGVVIDTETTGVHPDRDKIIELGMVLFEYDPETGIAYRVLGSFNQLEDPGFPVPPESTAVHGITDEMVADQRIDDEAVARFLDGVSLIVAHNSKFDRVFLEKRLPVFETLPWGCSLAEVDWSGEGISSAKLDYLAYRYGFFHEAHRAEGDCHALLEILQQTLPSSGSLVLKSILDKLPRKSYQIFAIGSPFESKELLKSRGYRWDGDKKCWHATVHGDDAIRSEVAWLKSHVYGDGKARVEIEVHNCLTRYSNRPGNRVTREI